MAEMAMRVVPNPVAVGPARREAVERAAETRAGIAVIQPGRVGDARDAAHSIRLRAPRQTSRP